MTLAGEKATKRTRLGKITASITRGTVKAANSCSRAQYHVIDSEYALGVLLARAASSLALFGDSESVEYGLKGIRPQTASNRDFMNDIRGRQSYVAEGCTLGGFHP